MVSPDLPLTTPVVVGAGQWVDHLGSDGYRGLSAVDLAGEAARRAVEDAGLDPADVGPRIDVVAATRTFEDSMPGAPAPLGRSNNPPRSIAARIGANPKRAVLDIAGGQSPQSLVREFCDVIHRGEASVVMIAGGEAISTIRHVAASGDEPPSFAEEVDGTLEDRGFGLSGLLTRQHLEHQVLDAPSQYALSEHARRGRLGLSRRDHAQSMGALFAPFSAAAAANPLAASQEARTADELVRVDAGNRMIADPYPRLLVARDQVNMGAAVLLMSLGAARDLGVSEDRMVYLHGTAQLREPRHLERPDLGAAPSAVEAVLHALDVAEVSVDEVACWDLYSCFPIAVSNVCDGLGLAADDPRGLTVTGGLPFFGGPGNNYSMHAIAEVVARVRSTPGVGVVGANGGVLSKYSVGVYAREPRAWRPDRSDELQSRLDAVPSQPLADRADGWATIESYTVMHRRSGSEAVVVGRLEADDRRFIALAADQDPAVHALVAGPDEPIGQRVFVRSFGFGNRVATGPGFFPDPEPCFRDDYEFVHVERRGRVLEVTINRVDARNALHPPANEELSDVFDAYFADDDLWVAILVGGGTESFCAGNDLLYTASGKPMYFPTSGFAGLTSRPGMHKPVIAAVNGYAMGGGFEAALACHLIVADETAQFALSEVSVGLVAGAGGLVRLPRVVSRHVANDLILTARRVGAEEAQRLGLVCEVAPEGEALDAARRLAERIVAMSPTSVRLSLQMMEETASMADPIEAVLFPSTAIDELLASADMVEGLTAFVQKRPPVWTNR